jgi:hypothetical protein
MVNHSNRSKRIRIILVLCLLTLLGYAVVSLADKGPGTTGKTTTPVAPKTSGPRAASLYDAICTGSVGLDVPAKLKTSDIGELSGLTASRTTEDTYWAHNDSGDKALLYAIKTDGSLLGSVELSEIAAFDWEAIASGPGPVGGKSYLYIADTGDNGLDRTEVEIHRLVEPALPRGGNEAKVSQVETLRFTYPNDEKHNVEAMFVDPITGKIYLIDKSEERLAIIYEAPAGLANQSATTLRQVSDVSYPKGRKGFERVTGADISPSGDTIAIRTYESLHTYRREPGSAVATAFAGKVCSAPTIGEPQGEAVAFNKDGTMLITIGEGRTQPIHRLLY